MIALDLSKQETFDADPKGFSWNHRPIVHLPPITYQPNKRPTNHRPPPADQMHRQPTNRPSTSKKFEDQKKFEFTFDINYDFKP